MRWLWRQFVPGEMVFVLVWIGSAIYKLATQQYPWVLFNCVMAALNLYSWDWQRRRAAGHRMP